MIVKVVGGYLEVETGQGSQPPGIWGGGNVPMPNPPIANVPGAPGYHPPGGDHIWGPPGPWPTPPIHMPPGQGGGNPPGIWGPPGPWPTPPIHLPPDSIKPPIPLPPGIWPNPPEGTAPIPEHPIVIPPPEGSPPNTPALEVKTLWSAQTGWVVVLVPTGEHVAPS